MRSASRRLDPGVRARAEPDRAHSARPATPGRRTAGPAHQRAPVPQGRTVPRRPGGCQGRQPAGRSRTPSGTPSSSWAARTLGPGRARVRSGRLPFRSGPTRQSGCGTSSATAGKRPGSLLDPGMPPSARRRSPTRSRPYAALCGRGGYSTVPIRARSSRNSRTHSSTRWPRRRSEFVGLAHSARGSLTQSAKVH
jgi:hypothetical protein